MNFKTLTAAALLWFGLLATDSSSLLAQDGILFKVQEPGTNYCHLKFPAIREDTLHMDRPLLTDASTGDIIDLHGPCDYNPTGKDALQAQRQQKSRMWSRAYAD